MSNIAKYLFETSALKVSPNDKPFWYTSRKNRTILYQCRIPIWK